MFGHGKTFLFYAKKVVFVLYLFLIKQFIQYVK